MGGQERVFSKVRDVDAAVGGVWKDSGVGGTPVAQAFYATLGADAHVALTVTWNVALSDGLPNPAADGVFITWESGDRSVQGRTEVYHTLASTALVYTYYPSVNWTLRLWALIDGEETYLGVIPQITTSGVPTPTNLQLSAALDQRAERGDRHAELEPGPVRRVVYGTALLQRHL